MTRQLLCIDIVQSNVTKVLLKHLVKHYTVKCINNHVDFTKMKDFFSKKDFYWLKSLTNFNIIGMDMDKSFE